MKYPALALAVITASMVALPVQAQQPGVAQVERAATPQVAAAEAAFLALPEEDRKQIQDDLIWASNFTATVSGQHGPRTHAAVLNFQRSIRARENGILDEGQRRALHDFAQRARTAARLTMQADPRTGARLPIPGALFTKRETLPTGTRWESADGAVVLETGVGKGGADELPAAFERFVTLNAPGRRVTYKLLRPDFFVVAGDIGDRNFYVRYAVGPNNLRGYALSFPAARAKSLERYVIAIANGFEAAPGTAPAVAANAIAAASNPAPAPAAATPTLPAGLILTGLVVAPGRIVTASLAAACPDLNVNGRPARLTKPGSAMSPAEIEADTSRLRPFALPLAPATVDAAVVVVGFSGGPQPQLSVATGTIAAALPDGPRITAPVAAEGGGSLVIDRGGHLVAMLLAPRAAPRLVAGFVPATSHAALSASALGPSETSGSAGKNPVAAMTAGAIAAAISPSLAAITCTRPVAIP